MMTTKLTLPQLPYAYDDLEPYIDAKTMEIHHTKHHQAYLDNLLKCTEVDFNLPLEEMLVKYEHIPAVRNHGGGYYNHNVFWKMMSPKGGGEPTGELKSAIEAAFGDFANFKAEFKKAAMGRFGSGWAWLLREKHSKKIRIESKPNQDHPDLAHSIPLLGLDVWEHAYYLKYQNKRPDYVDAWWNVVNWNFAAEQFKK